MKSHPRLCKQVEMFTQVKSACKLIIYIHSACKLIIYITLQVIGLVGQKKLAEIEIKLQASESNENTDEVTMNTQQNTLDKNHTQYEINNVWKAIEELKNQLAILSSNITSKVINANASVVTPTHVEDTKSSNSTSNVTIASTSAAIATHAEDTSSYNSTSK